MTQLASTDGLSTISLAHFNEDWLGWPDAPGGEDWKDADPDSTYWTEKSASEESWGADAAQLAYENAHLEYDPQVGDLFRYQDNCAEAGWYAFCAK